MWKNKIAVLVGDYLLSKGMLLCLENDDFDLLKIISGKDSIKEYLFKTETAKHFFCKLCGIKSFYQPRSHPDAYSVNLKCVENPPEVHEIVHFDGLNFEESIKQI